MTVLLVVVIAACVVVAVLWPLRPGVEAQQERSAALRRADLEAAKEARYLQIRDAELDRETGKLSPDDWRAIDRELRADAARILEELDSIDGSPTPSAG